MNPHASLRMKKTLLRLTNSKKGDPQEFSKDWRQKALAKGSRKERQSCNVCV